MKYADVLGKKICEIKRFNGKIPSNILINNQDLKELKSRQALTLKLEKINYLPEPKILTEEDMKKIDKESKEAVEGMLKRTKKLELTSDDYKIIIK